MIMVMRTEAAVARIMKNTMATVMVLHIMRMRKRQVIITVMLPTREWITMMITGTVTTRREIPRGKSLLQSMPSTTI